MAGALYKLGNSLRVWPLLIGLPSPPYTRRNALVIETVGRKSGKLRRVPVGFLEESGRLIVVTEHGSESAWVRNALARDGRLRVFHEGRWSDARLRLVEGDPDQYLARMNRAHAALLRRHSTARGVAELTLA
jgi:deazaflavin-dependent oxidoreductase (nitroreductase family)